MHKKRLLKLADLVEQSVAQSRGRKGFQFDMWDWGYNENGDQPALDCGTRACMMGVAALSGSFARAGLYGHVQGPFVSIRTRSGAQGGIQAAQEVFGLTSEEAEFLFMVQPESKEGNNKGVRGAKYHAKRVRDFVANEGIF